QTLLAQDVAGDRHRQHEQRRDRRNVTRVVLDRPFHLPTPLGAPLSSWNFSPCEPARARACLASTMPVDCCSSDAPGVLRLVCCCWGGPPVGVSSVVIACWVSHGTLGFSGGRAPPGGGWGCSPWSGASAWPISWGWLGGDSE